MGYNKGAEVRPGTSTPPSTSAADTCPCEVKKSPDPMKNQPINPPTNQRTSQQPNQPFNQGTEARGGKNGIDRVPKTDRS